MFNEIQEKSFLTVQFEGCSVICGVINEYQGHCDTQNKYRIWKFR
jgi:hypothetical protein